MSTRLNRKILYRVFRKIIRKTGYDLIPIPKEKLGIDPYQDMEKFIFRNDPIVLDIGANIGQSIGDFKEVFSDAMIHSFEPDPSAFRKLKEKIVHLSKVQVWNVAVGSSTESLLLNTNSSSNMSSFLELGESGWGRINEKLPVEVTTIDTFCEKHKLDNIEVLKIDTQGFELEVLKGAQKSLLKNRIGLIFLEVTFIDMYKELPKFGELYDFVIKNGFDLVSIYPIKYRNSVAGWTDLLFKHRNFERRND